MPYSLRSRRCPPLQPPRPTTHRPPQQSPTLFALPRSIRNTIYRHILHDDAPEAALWDRRTPPHVSLGNLGLLCSCRRIYKEASAISYATVHLGSDASLAKAYLKFIKPRRVRQIRNLTIFYECRRVCSQEQGYGDCLDWMAAFELLRKARACVEHVVVRFDPCCAWLSGGQRYLRRRCRLEWNEEEDRFWCGLKTLTTAREIHFEGAGVPEYFVHRHVRQLGWQMDGVVENDRSDRRVVPFTTFRGRLVNPACSKQATDVSEYGRELLRSGRRVGGEVKPGKRPGFWSLPPEIRRIIYDHASEWVYKPFWPVLPGRYNTGVALLHVSKHMCADALPSIYRTFRIYGGAPLATLDKLGANLAFVRTLETHFSCFCPWGGSNLQLNNGTIYAVCDPEATNQWSRPPSLKDWYPTGSVVTRYEDEWDQVMWRVKTQSVGLSELAVTYLSCSRSASLLPSWVSSLTTSWVETLRYKGCCIAIESKFNQLLEGLGAVNNISLGGNVPPSMAVRLARPWFAPRRSLKGISRVMGEYIKDTEERVQVWKMLPVSNTFWTLRVWMNPTVYPPLEYHSARGQAPHFVLTRNETARNRWSQCVEPESKAELGKEVDAVVELILSRSSWDIERDMDRATVMFTDEDWG